MKQRYVSTPLKSNFIPSKFMSSKKILFDANGSVDKKTGEIRAKEFSITCNVVDGTKANFCPKATVTMKLGNDTFRLVAENFDDIAEALFQASNFIQENAKKGNHIKWEESSKWSEIQGAIINVRNAG